MALQQYIMALATAAMAISPVAAYAVVDVDSLALADFRAPAVNAAVAARSSNATPPADTSAAGYLHFDVVHSTNVQHFGKRAVVELSLTNRSDIAYYAKLNFGTPAQPQYVQLDTGSFELWVNPSCSSLSTSDAAFCNSLGSYDPSASSTFKSLGSGKTLRYGIGSANISYVKDTISLPGGSSGSSKATLSNVQFGVATASADEFAGILGIGYGLNLTTRYPNFIDELASQNVTQVKAFSVALGSKVEQQGVITFGGVDTSKFAGSLARLPIAPAASSPDGVPRYWINMTSMAMSTPSSSSSSSSQKKSTSKDYRDSAMQVFLDTGSTLTLLPPDLVAAIAADFDAAGPTADGFYLVDCALRSQPGTLDFAFAGVTISVPYSELIRQSGSQCALGLQASDSFALLGDTFMRSAYVVIDQTSNAVWMAPYVNCGSTPSALASEAALAALTGACSSSSSSSSSTTTTGSANANADKSDAASSAAASAATPAISTATAAASASAATPTKAAASTSSAQASSASAAKSSGALIYSLFVAAVLSAWLR